MQGIVIGSFEAVVIAVYVLAIGFLGYLGYRHTKTAADYLVAGRGLHPFIMAMSYGATFISTSAIVGFGGVAAMFGMSLMWLVFLNIAVGIFIAFVFLGGRTRRMGHHLGAHTFPELLGARFQSPTLRVLAGLIVTVFIPLYAAAVLMGACKFIADWFQTDYNGALLVFGGLVALYVVVGGLKGVMYTDAFQGTIMFVGMLVLLGITYWQLGGPAEAHQTLTDMKPMVPEPLVKMGHQGWTAMPAYGFDAAHSLWWVVVSTIILGVGIGVLAQPQLVVRFMTVRSQRELNRAVLMGGLFVLAIPGTAYLVGTLSNAWCVEQGPLLRGEVVAIEDPQSGLVQCRQLQQLGPDGQWSPLLSKSGEPVAGTLKLAPAADLPSEAPTTTAPTLSGVAVPPPPAVGGQAIGRSISLTYAGGLKSSDQVIPTYIRLALPRWFGVLFLLTLLAAGMSTLSSQFHTLGTSIGHDVVEAVSGRRGGNVLITRAGIVAGIGVAMALGYAAQYGSYVIARATAIFFGLCASAFLPAFVGGLFFRRITRAGALASMVAGFLATAFWLTLVKAKEASAIGVVHWLLGPDKASLLHGQGAWAWVDPICVGLPISIATAGVVSLLTQPPDQEHLDRCFASSDRAGV